jgi:hypothetical protein
MGLSFTVVVCGCGFVPDAKKNTTCMPAARLLQLPYFLLAVIMWLILFHHRPVTIFINCMRVPPTHNFKFYILPGLVSAPG